MVSIFCLLFFSPGVSENHTHTHTRTHSCRDRCGNAGKVFFSESRLAGGACVSAFNASVFFFLLSQEVKSLVMRTLERQPVNGLESAEKKLTGVCEPG